MYYILILYDRYHNIKSVVEYIRPIAPICNHILYHNLAEITTSPTIIFRIYDICFLFKSLL